MLQFAVTVDGKPIFPECFTESEWQMLKDTYQIGDFLTPCCGTPAIPKTSINLVRFFAHHSDECTTSPESLWHLSSKDRVARELMALGISAVLEKPASCSEENFKSDVSFEIGTRKIAIEVQHSYQNLRIYLQRQKKYSAHGIENYWLLYRPRYMTMVKSIARLRLRNEFGGKFPSCGFITPCIPELPMAFFEPDVEEGVVFGAGGLRVPITEWLKSLIQSAFTYQDERWRIS